MDELIKSLNEKRKVLRWSSKKLAKMANLPYLSAVSISKGIEIPDNYASHFAKVLNEALKIKLGHDRISGSQKNKIRELLIEKRKLTVNSEIESIKDKQNLSDVILGISNRQSPAWSGRYERCKRCGTTEIRHRAYGFCIECYQIEKVNRQKKHARKHGAVSEKLTKEYLIQEYINKEKSLNDIAIECSCSRSYVHKKMKAFKIPLRSKSSARILAVEDGKLRFERVNPSGEIHYITLSKTKIDENFFSSWSAGMAWVLGIIYTDGNLSFNDKSYMTCLGFSQKDPELLEKLKTLMKCNARIYYSPRREYKSGTAGEIYTLQIHDKNIFSDLLILGLSPRKSLDMGFPNIPAKHIRHFIRGCWDGDGSVYIENKRGKIGASYVSGSLNFIEGMLSELEKAGLPRCTIYTLKRSKNPTYSFRFWDKQCEKLYHYFYDDVPPEQYLQRKHDIFYHYFFRTD